MSKAISRTDLRLGEFVLEVVPPVVRSIRASMRDFRGSALTVPQFRVLGFVSLGPCTGKQIAESQGVSGPAMSRMVNCLVRRRFLIRRRDSADRRRSRLALSDKGKTEFERLRHALRLALAGRIMQLSSREKLAVFRGLTVLRDLFGES